MLVAPLIRTPKMLRNLMVVCTAVLMFVACNVVRAENSKSLTRMSDQASQSIVYLSLDYIDKMTGTQKSEYGSGFIVSESGYVLTAFHVIEQWQKQSDSNKIRYPLMAAIGSRYGPKYQLVYIASDTAADFAILKINQLNQPQPVPLCFTKELSSGDSIYAFGFPNDFDFTPLPGTFSNTNGKDGRWEAAIAFTHGMSGGPVYDKDGIVVGIIKGGIDFSAATSLVTPVKWTRPMLSSRADIVENCAVPNLSEPDSKSPLGRLFYNFGLNRTMMLSTIKKDLGEPNYDNGSDVFYNLPDINLIFSYDAQPNASNGPINRIIAGINSYSPEAESIEPIVLSGSWNEELDNNDMRVPKFFGRHSVLGQLRLGDLFTSALSTCALESRYSDNGAETLKIYCDADGGILRVGFSIETTAKLHLHEKYRWPIASLADDFGTLSSRQNCLRCDYNSQCTRAIYAPGDLQCTYSNSSDSLPPTDNQEILWRYFLSKYREAVITDVSVQIKTAD